MWSNRNSYSLLVEMQGDTATLEDHLVVSCKTKPTLTIRPRHHTSWCLPKGAENLCPHRNLHMGIYGYFIHNCQNLKVMRML